MSDEAELSTLMRDGLGSEARRVDASAPLTERLITTATATSTGPAWTEPSRRGWQNWVLPAVAATLVALLFGSVLIATKLVHSARQAPATRISTPAAPTPSPDASLHASPSKSASSPPSSSVAQQPPSTDPGTGPAGGPVPAGFHPYDLTWVSSQTGWALGTAPCATAPCTSIARTSDGGRSWVGIHAPAAFLAQTDTCQARCDLISQLRFATPLIGYAYGIDSFFMTTNGGNSWLKQPGFAYALEVVGGSVLRVSAQAAGCAPGCTFTVQRAAIGSGSWQNVALPSGGRTAGALLAASGSTVVLATLANPAGGAQDAQAVLFVSADAGNSWRAIGEPCPQAAGGEVDTTAVSVAPDESITALCRSRGPSGGLFTVTSTDAGRHFTAGVALPGTAAASSSGFAAASARVLVVSADRLYRSDDGGAQWSVVPSGPAQASFVGFESPTLGRAVRGPAADPQIWTTSDGGASWTADAIR
jgi:hypothetical protein